MKKKVTQKLKNKRAIMISPTIEEQQHLLNLYNQGLFVDAVESAEAFIAEFPKYNSFAWKVLGSSLQNLGRTSDALNVKRKTVELFPNDADAITNLGNQYLAYELFAEAEICYIQALNINSNLLDAHINLGVALMKQKKLQDAESCFCQAIAINPNSNNIYDNLGAILERLRKLPEAQEAYIKEFRRNPKNREVVAQLNHTSRNLCDWSENYSVQLLESLSCQKFNAALPFSLLAFHDVNLAHLKLAGYLYADFRYKKQLSKTTFVSKIKKKYQKLRIGYLSADFHLHATVHLMAGILENRNTENFDVYLYSYGVEAKDDARYRVENACEVFRNIRELSDDEAAQQILADEIDILVDLKGYTADCRLGIQALRPAPIIVSWLGYPATLGHERLAAMQLSRRWNTLNTLAKHWH